MPRFSRHPEDLFKSRLINEYAEIPDEAPVAILLKGTYDPEDILRKVRAHNPDHLKAWSEKGVKVHLSVGLTTCWRAASGTNQDEFEQIEDAIMNELYGEE